MCALPDVRDVFDLFDFWDGRDGMVDGAKLGDVMRCIGLNPTNKMILDNGGSKKLGLSCQLRRRLIFTLSLDVTVTVFDA